MPPSSLRLPPKKGSGENSVAKKGAVGRRPATAKLRRARLDDVDVTVDQYVLQNRVTEEL
jgi:hypothetical protein